MFKKVVMKAKNLTTGSGYKKAGAVAVMGLASGSANAALTAEMEAAKTALITLINDLSAMAWEITPLVVVAFIGLGLFKKFASKAAS